jgi:26S proteasome regulatory subunit N2
VLDKHPDEPRETIELRASKEVKQAAAPETIQDRTSVGATLQVAGHAGAERDAATGAAIAAGVLTAVDEDEEGGEEAPVPDEFGYETDNMDQD